MPGFVHRAGHSEVPAGAGAARSQLPAPRSMKALRSLPLRSVYIAVRRAQLCPRRLSPLAFGPTTPNQAGLRLHAESAPADDSSCVPGVAGFRQILDVSIALRSLSSQSGSFNFLLSESHGE